MKEESLLSNLSNISYHGKNLNYDGADFFNKSLPAGQTMVRSKNESSLGEVNINQLNFEGNRPQVGKDKNLLSAFYWACENAIEGESENMSQPQKNEAEKQDEKNVEKEKHKKQTVKIQNPQLWIPMIQHQPQGQFSVKIEEQEDSSSYLKKSGTKRNINTNTNNNINNQKRDHEKMISTRNKEKVRKNRRQQELELNGSQEQIGTVIKNETKNIPKNYGKAIITYVEKFREQFEPILLDSGVEYKQFVDELMLKKKSINTIANLRDLWVDFKYSKCMRILSNQFLRKHALHYIFNSRICNYTSHIKYRKRLQEAIEAPGSFCHIKEY